MITGNDISKIVFDFFHIVLYFPHLICNFLYFELKFFILYGERDKNWKVLLSVIQTRERKRERERKTSGFLNNYIKQCFGHVISAHFYVERKIKN